MKERKNAVGIPLLDLKAQDRTIGSEIRKAIEEVLDSQRFILGPAVRRFETEAASHLRCAAAVGVASGSDALLLSLMALGIGPGDAVLVPPFTFFSTVSCIARLGATPVFVDIDPESCLIDPRETERLIEERFQSKPGGGLMDPKSGCRVGAILPVHLFGRCCAMKSLLSLAEKHQLKIVEDAAQAFGARTQLSPGVFKPAGTVGDLGCFSFFPSKILGGIGDGGLVATDNGGLAEKIRILRAHGANSKYHHVAIGLNSRLDEIQAAALSVKLRYLDQWCQERIERARTYHSLFSEAGLVGDEVLSLPGLGTDRSHVFNYYVIRARRRDDLKLYLEERGIETEIYYPLPLHLQPCFAYLGYKKSDLPKAELAAEQILALPMYPELTHEQQGVVLQRIKDFYRR